MTEHALKSEKEVKTRDVSFKNARVSTNHDQRQNANWFDWRDWQDSGRSK